MKRYFTFIVIFVSFTLSICFSQKKVYQYKVNVVNKVVYARVFYNGKLVDNLSKDDFILYENGKKRKIEAIDIVHKRFGKQIINFEGSIKKQNKPRYFVLTFDITDYGENIKKGLNYLFDDVLRESDKLMFMSRNHFFREENLEHKDRIKQKIVEILKRESILARMEQNGIFSQVRSIKQAIEEYQASQRGRNSEFFDPRKLEMIKNKILLFVRWYKKRYLIPDIDKFYYFAQYLNNLKMDKWVLNFYQIKKIPIPKEIIEFWDKEMSRWAFDPLINELNIPDDFPSEEIKKLFYKVNTTFYTFLLTKQKETLDKDYVFKTIYTDLEKTLKEISFATGGDSILSNDIVESFKKVEEEEDIIYLIYYKQLVDNPKIKIRMKNKKFKVKYDSQQFADYIKEYLEKKERENPEIKITNFLFNNNKLHFVLKDYKIEKFKEAKRGKVFVSIRIVSPDGVELFNQKKIIEPIKSITKIGIKLRSVKKGIAYLYLDVYDFLTKRKDAFFEIVEIK